MRVRVAAYENRREAALQSATHGREMEQLVLSGMHIGRIDAEIGMKSQVSEQAFAHHHLAGTHPVALGIAAFKHCFAGRIYGSSRPLEYECEHRRGRVAVHIAHHRLYTLG